MQELQKFWNSRPPAQRAAIIAGFVATFVLVFVFAGMAGRGNKALLYAGLEPADASAIIAEIEQAGIAYDIRGNAIWVDEVARDRLRMDLAARNLPSGGGSAGYEILDQMSGFSTTSQMFDAAFWRAKEGELARTILALPNVKSARVHLTAPRARGYRSTEPGAASVTIVTHGGSVTAEQGRALRYLVASAVPGLDVDGVTVIDSARGVVSADENIGEAERARELKRNVERILLAHVGADNAIVELNLDLVTETEHLTERRLDPTQRAVISEETEELTDESSMAQAAAVTAASNLPDRDQSASGDRETSQRLETRQRANYDVGTITRQVERQPGAVRRMTVAVLVNGVPQTGPDGASLIVPRSEAQLAALRDLVAAASGFDAARGDELTIRSLPFAALAEAGTTASREGGLMDRLHLNNLAQMALVGLFAVLALGLTMRQLRSRGKTEGGAPALDDSAPVPAALPDFAIAEAPMGEMPMMTMAAADFDFDTPSGGGGDPVARLRQLMKERREESVRLLGGWIEKDGIAR
ncbi:MAG: flagellar basal-body MS-ring/collar protein FliF [Paracoccus sp. (in: a-proteobacteria)]|nr:flagellar basal-body MS-ring/collar protein FliF [Paracoccus sp. (in: a-proteobacteria)]